MKKDHPDKTNGPDWGALLARVGNQGDRTAFRQVYSHFAPRIKAYAINQGMNHCAEDLVQEVMINIWRNANKYNASLSSASTWIFTITRNQRIDLLRKKDRTKSEVTIDTEELWQIPIEDITARSVQIISTEKSVRASIGTLPEEQVAALRKVYYEGKTHQEAAVELDVPLGTLKGRLRLSIKKLHTMLETEDL